MRFVLGLTATPQGLAPDRYGGDDRVAGAVDDGDVVAAVVRHVDAVRVGVDGHALGATPDRYGGDDRVAGAVDDGDVVAARFVT